MEKQLTMAHMACQNFRERSLWVRSWRDLIIRSCLTWQTRSLFLRHFCDNHACFMVKITTKRPGTAPESFHTNEFLDTVPCLPVPRLPPEGSLGTPKILATGATLRLRPIRLHSKLRVPCLKIVSTVPKSWRAVPLF